MTSIRTDLFSAIDAGDVVRVRRILESEPSLATARDDEGVSALMRARYRLDRGLIEAVHAYVADLDVFEAAAFGDLDRLISLLQGDPTLVAARAGDGFTALHLAAFFGQAEAAVLLLARGADPDAHGTGWMTGTPLHSAASTSRADIVALLLDDGADPNARQGGGWTALHAAVEHGDAAIVGRLLVAGADPDAVNDDGVSARDLAAVAGDEATIRAIGG